MFGWKAIKISVCQSLVRWSEKFVIWFYMLTYIFFLASQDQEDNVYKRDFAKPTLEDHFDKTVIPKVMQVSACNSVKQHSYVLFFLPLLFLRRLYDNYRCHRKEGTKNKKQKETDFFLDVELNQEVCNRSFIWR